MRDQWKAEDDHRDQKYWRGRSRSGSRSRDKPGRRHGSPEPPLQRRRTSKRDHISDRDRTIDTGRSTTGYRPSSRLYPERNRRRSRSIERYQPVSREVERPQDISSADTYKPQHHRESEDRRPAKDHKARSPSRSRNHPHQPFRSRRSRSPTRSGRVNKHEKREKRPLRSRSPLYKENRSGRREDIPPADSYLPKREVRQRSPPTRRKGRRAPSPIHSHEPSPRRRIRSRSTSRHRSSAVSRIYREDSAEFCDSRSSTPPPSSKPSGGKRRPNMYPSARPIQSVVNDRNAPRPIPSFDSQNTHDPMDGDAQIRESYPMHGMRSNSRPHRPPIDTRSNYSQSPSYVTPNNSHHTSPQSGSPFAGGRGNWSGQQQYHGQPTG